jgi:hypothetical protein
LYKNLPFGYSKEPNVKFGDRLFFMTVPKPEELDLMIDKLIELIKQRRIEKESTEKQEKKKSVGGRKVSS